MDIIAAVEIGKVIRIGFKPMGRHDEVWKMWSITYVGYKNSQCGLYETPN